MLSSVRFPCRFAAFLAASVTVCCAAEPVRLSLKEAIRLALLPAGQARLQLAQEAESAAESRVKQARAATALQVGADLSDRVLRFDLRSIGFDIPEVSPFVANVQFPSVVGPFTVLDSRIRATKSVLNKPAARQVQAAKESVEAVKTQNKGVAAQIAAQTARAYLDALRAKSEIDLAAENLKVREGGVSLAEARRTNGLVTGSDVRRANLDLNDARETLFAAQTAYQKATLQLVAAIGLPFETAVELTDHPEFQAQKVSLEDAVQTAFRSRPELSAADQEIATLRLNEQAIDAQGLPTLALFADGGAVTVAPTPAGNSTIVSTPTYTAGFEFSLLLFDHGRRASRSAEIDSQIRQAKIRQQVERRQIELQVRLAFQSLTAAAHQVELAQQKSTLAEDNSAETRARYDAGEASGLDLSEAQAEAFRSHHDYVLALYQHEVARVALAEAMGDILEFKW